MLRKRGVPVFVELLRDKDSRTHTEQSAARDRASPVPQKTVPTLFETPSVAAQPPSRGGGGFTPTPIQTGVVGTIRPASVDVEPKGPLAAPTACDPQGSQSTADDAGFLSSIAGLPRPVLFTIAGVVLLIAIVWYVGYSTGHNEGENKTKQAMSDLVNQDRARLMNQGSGNGSNGPTGAKPEGAKSDGTNPPGKIETPKPAPKPNAEPAPAANNGTDKLVPGYNYLVAVTLMRKDADEAAKYLTENNVQVAVINKDGIDPSDPRVNNPSLQWQVVVLKGYAPEDFRRTESERFALQNQVQKLGRKWKAENKRAPTDFGQVFWQKYKAR